LTPGVPWFLPGPRRDSGQRCSKPILFLDRDGVIIANRHDYVTRIRDVRFLPGTVSALRRLGRSHELVIVSNQAVVGKGIITAAAALDVHQSVVNHLDGCGVDIAASLICPHVAADGCSCRKPGTGMLAFAEERLGTHGSALVGDAATDVAAAERWGIDSVLVLTGRGVKQLPMARRLVKRLSVFPNLWCYAMFSSRGILSPRSP